MIPQQILLREFMRIRKLTRNTMAEQLGITRRRLDSWLLPDDSNNFRSASDNVLRSIETQLRTQVHWHSATPLPDGFDEQQRVRMVLSRVEVVFPLPWLIVEEAPVYEIPEAVKVKGKWVPPAEELKNTGEMGRYESLVLGRDTPYSPQCNGCVVEARPLVKAELVDGVAYWIFISHLASPDVVEGYFMYAGQLMNVGFLNAPACESAFGCVKEGNNYFAMAMIKAPEQHPEPLLIYVANHIETFPIFGDQVVFKDSLCVIDHNGHRSDMLPYVGNDDDE